MVSTTLLQPPSAADPAHTQAILQAAPAFLKAQRTTFTLPYPFNLLVSNESQEKWASYENILVASLETGDYEKAKECVDALTDRFGMLNERVLVMKGMYQEAVAVDEKDLMNVLKHYDAIIEESPTMFGVRKRRVALLKSLGRTTDAVASLVDLLDHSPTDAESWAELADLYTSQGALERAIFCLEEVLLVMPNAWNIQAKLGEVLYLSASTTDGPDRIKLLSESMRRFCRSIELSGSYLRAFYGLKLVTSQLLPLVPTRDGVVAKASQSTEVPVPSTATLEKLNQLATAKLAEITRSVKSSDLQWDGYNALELTAAQALLATEDTKQAR